MAILSLFCCSQDKTFNYASLFSPVWIVRGGECHCWFLNAVQVMYKIAHITFGAKQIIHKTTQITYKTVQITTKTHNYLKTVHDSYKTVQIIIKPHFWTRFTSDKVQFWFFPTPLIIFIPYLFEGKNSKRNFSGVMFSSCSIILFYWPFFNVIFRPAILVERVKSREK